jgi:hypothetical protein
MMTQTTMDRNAAVGTAALLAALRAGGYDVQTPVTGSVIVDGQEIDSAAWDRMVMEWDGSADGLEDMGWEHAADAMRDEEEDADRADTLRRRCDEADARDQSPAAQEAAQIAHDEQMLQAGGMAPVDCLEDLLALVPNLSEQALTNLPTFGGEAPASARGVFSWDASRLLVQDRTGWRIVARSERQ